MNSNNVSFYTSWTVGLGIFLAFFLACAGNVEAGVDFSNMSDVNLIVAIIIGLLLGAFVYFICFQVRVRRFVKVVRQGTFGPKAAYQISWGQGSKIVSGIISFIIALGAAYMAFLSLSG